MCFSSGGALAPVIFLSRVLFVCLISRCNSPLLVSNFWLIRLLHRQSLCLIRNISVVEDKKQKPINIVRLCLLELQQDRDPCVSRTYPKNRVHQGAFTLYACTFYYSSKLQARFAHVQGNLILVILAQWLHFAQLWYTYTTAQIDGKSTIMARG